MGEINVQGFSKPAGRPRVKKLSTRVDLTPMVDLGFLLITFFIFTTSMSEPMAMKLKVPKDSIDSSEVPATKTLNIIIAGNNKIISYTGTDIHLATSANSKGEEIRKIITSKKQETVSLPGKKNELYILIKPTTDATYESIVNVLDEMAINNIGHYVLMEPSEEETALAGKY